ncbi:MAG: hypothetical protein NT062_17830, partial [Proteobacteria bacterium]|nr:hypothetical protein [Pseudomonadota bacterium]
LGEMADVDVIVEATISLGTFPVAWILKSRPNVVTWDPGHRREKRSVPAMTSGLVDMIRIASKP